MSKLKNVDYDSLDRAKNAFIEASRRTAKFAEPFGFIPEGRFGSSANIFSLDLKPFLKAGAEQLHVSLIPEGLGTADDARPDDLSAPEAREFWRNIGMKTVSVLTNDAAAGGLQTILIGLYLPSGSPEIVFDAAFMEGFLGGFVEGCRQVGCVYFSGETPQLKSKFLPGKLDIAGALFALLPPGAALIDKNRLVPGNSIVLVESSGPHENGFTVLRGLAAALPGGYRAKLPSGIEYWRAINAASKLYTPLVQGVLNAGITLSGVENITGHGWQKIMRSAKPLRYRISKTPPVPEIFEFVEKSSGASKEEMLSTFNCGTGMAIFCQSEKDAAKTCEIAAQHGLKAVIGGRVEESRSREVIAEPFGVTLSGDKFALKSD